MRALLQHRVLRASALRVLALSMGVVASVLISRLGGADVKGVTSAFAATTVLVFTAVNLDLAQQTLRNGRDTNNLNGVRARMFRLWPWYGALTLVGVAVGVAIGNVHVVWIAVGAFAYLISAHMGIACTGLSGPQVTAVGAVIQQGGMVVATLLAFAAGGIDVEDGALIVVASYLLPVPLFIWAARPRESNERGPVGEPASLPTLMRSGVRWQVARVAQLLLLRIDTLCVFWFLGATAAGIYSVGLATAALAGLVPAQFASNTTYEATLGYIGSMRRNTTHAAWTGLAGALGLTVAGWPLLVIAYGRAFEDSYVVMLATLPGIVAYGVLQVFTNQTRLVGEAKTVTIPSVVGLAVMVAALAALLPLWGNVGAGLASSAGAMAAVVTAFLLWRRRVGLLT